MYGLQAAYGWVCILFVLSSGCAGETQEAERQNLDKRKAEIMNYVRSVPCGRGDDHVCKVAGIGAKPCGGPRDYVVFSSSIDTVRLFRMLTEYHQLEDAFNRRWGLYSDCSIPPPPDSVKCLHGVCVGYWSGLPR